VILGIVLGLLTAVSLGLMLRPLLIRGDAARPRAAYDAEVYRDQLAELDREIARGVIEGDEAEAARAEIARRLLASDTAITKDTKGASPAAGRRTGSARAVAIVLAIALPLGAAVIYLGQGSPNLPGQPFASRQSRGIDPATSARMESAIKTIEARLAAKPKSVGLWGRLGRIYFALGRHIKAAEAFRKALELRPKSANYAASYGEAVVFANRRVVVPRAKALFERALKADPRDVRARFYLGLAKAQAGNRDGALRDWIALEAEAGAGAAWRRQLASFIETTAKQAGLTKAALVRLRAAARKAAAKRVPKTASKTAPKTVPNTARGPSREDVARAGRMSPADRAAMIRGMVSRLAARLKEKPDDLAGWRRLGRAYIVLRDYPKAVAAHGQAARLAPRNVAVLVDYGQAMLAEHGKDTDLPPKFVAVMKRIHTLEPDHVIGLWFLGMAQYEAGNRGRAAALWTRLLARLPKDAPERAALAKRIEMLKMKK